MIHLYNPGVGRLWRIARLDARKARPAGSLQLRYKPLGAGKMDTGAEGAKMANSEVSHNIQGSWRGCYFYAVQLAGGRGFGFEAVFLESGGVLEGNILDDSHLGEAVVSGSFTYPTVTFVKRYRNKPGAPIRYEGTMSEDGKTLQGSWFLISGQGSTRGTWVANRTSDGEDLTFKRENEEETEDEREKVMVRPMTQGAR
jgi:hypothetical protein